MPFEELNEQGWPLFLLMPAATSISVVVRWFSFAAAQFLPIRRGK